jgi:hypothetical protein
MDVRILFNNPDVSMYKINSRKISSYQSIALAESFTHPDKMW